MNIKDRIDSIFDEIVAIRRDFHAHPELSEEEVRTEQKISEYLTSWGIEHTTGVAGHGIVAIVRGKGCPEGKGKTIGIRGDIDALPIQETNEVSYKSQVPGVMHACGHDIHTSALLGSAKIFKEMEQELCGNVKFFFQPSEETCGGAERMILEGCMENPKVEAVIGLHVEGGIPAGSIQFRKGKMNAASNEFTIHVEGASAHGAHPENGIDSIVVASHIVSALQSIVSRNVSPTNSAVVTVGQFHSGSKNNIVPKDAMLSGIIRTLDPDTRAFMKKRVAEVATNVATAFGATAHVEITDSYPALENNSEILDVIEAVAIEQLGQDKIHYMPESSMGAEDFSYFCNAAKGCYFNIGTKAPGDTSIQTLHSDFFCPDESCIKIGMTIEIFSTLELLKSEK